MTKQMQKSQFARGLEGKARFNPRAEIEATLDTDSYEDFMRAMKDAAVPVRAICLSLGECGVAVSSSAIQRWKRALDVK